MLTITSPSLSFLRAPHFSSSSTAARAPSADGHRGTLAESGTYTRSIGARPDKNGIGRSKAGSAFDRNLDCAGVPPALHRGRAENCDTKDAGRGADRFAKVRCERTDGLLRESDEARDCAESGRLKLYLFADGKLIGGITPFLPAGKVTVPSAIFGITLSLWPKAMEAVDDWRLKLLPARGSGITISDSRSEARCLCIGLSTELRCRLAMETRLVDEVDKVKVAASSSNARGADGGNAETGKARRNKTIKEWDSDRCRNSPCQRDGYVPYEAGSCSSDSTVH
jgi:hypothetical protein